MSIDQTAIEMADFTTSTETLEAELRERSEALSRHQARFQQVRDELARRRAAKDDQPTPETDEQRTQTEQQRVARVDNSLVLKITTMELQQAELVVEAEIAKAGRLEAERRLGLLADNASKMLAAKRAPLTREAAQALANQHKAKDKLDRVPLDWVIDAIVEASTK